MEYPIHGMYDYHEILWYYDEIKKAYRKDFWKFDRETVMRVASRTRTEKYARRKIKNMPNPDRWHVWSIDFPVSCGIKFSDMMARQVQKQIEAVVGIENIHEVPNVSAFLDPFRDNRSFWCDDILILREIHDGIHYTYFQLTIPFHEEDPDNRNNYIFHSLSPYLWIKCSNKDFPQQEVEFMNEENEVIFEICDKGPDSLLPFDMIRPGNLRTRYGPDSEPKRNFLKWTYDTTGAWKTEIPEFYKICAANYEKILEKRRIREAYKIKPRGQKEKFPIETPNDCEGYPDLVFDIYLKEENASDAALDVEGAIADLNEKIEKKSRGRGFDYYDVQVKSENYIELFIDFGESDEKEYFTVLDTLSKLGLGIEKIIID